jgi:hypothetical protein
LSKKRRECTVKVKKARPTGDNKLVITTSNNKDATTKDNLGNK